jgi:hypothetical protein
MAAFCGCCGAEITLKAEACSVCGTPRHGMLKQDLPPASYAADHISKARRLFSCELRKDMNQPKGLAG